MSIASRHPGETFAGYTDLEVKVCAVCGVMYAAPARLFTVKLNAARDDDDSWYCPNGHELIFTDSEAEKLRKQLKRTKDQLASERARADQTEASLRATKGVVTRQRRKLEKVVAGVCPVNGCKRHFKDLQRHIETKHPEFKGEVGTSQHAKGARA